MIKIDIVMFLMIKQSLDFKKKLTVILGLEEDKSLLMTWEKLSTSIVTNPSGFTGFWNPDPVSWPGIAPPVSIDLWLEEN